MCKSQPKTKCSACGQLFDTLPCGDSPDFDAHVYSCPATPMPLDGESWEDYEIRAEKVKAEYLAQKGQK